MIDSGDLRRTRQGKRSDVPGRVVKKKTAINPTQNKPTPSLTELTV
uniref:Uncharacterized protein n=1 Tax=Anguilla anguilla TaxID=7936 RepID=A0A0E9QIK3_ANGAN